MRVLLGSMLVGLETDIDGFSSAGNGELHFKRLTNISHFVQVQRKAKLASSIFLLGPGASCLFFHTVLQIQVGHSLNCH